MRKFLERVRKQTGKSIKHFVITERGEQNGRIHMHGIWFGKAELLRKWQYGRVSVGNKELESYLKKPKGNFVGDKSINYIMKYIGRTNMKYKNHIGKVLCSKGIGANAIEKLKIYKKEESIYKDRSGRRHAMPEYFKKKIYTEKERDEMWVRKLDEGNIWVCGEEIKNINSHKGAKLYENALEYNRQRISRLVKSQKRIKIKK
jgi:hypothetical protein